VSISHDTTIKSTRCKLAGIGEERNNGVVYPVASIEVIGSRSSKVGLVLDVKTLKGLSARIRFDETKMSGRHEQAWMRGLLVVCIRRLNSIQR
jgi:hypothetical protein